MYTAKSDVYGFGVLLYEIYSGGSTPFANLQTSEVIRMVQAGERLARPSVVMDESIFALMRACTALNVGGRPSTTTVLACLSGTWTLSCGAAPVVAVANHGNDGRGGGDFLDLSCGPESTEGETAL